MNQSNQQKITTPISGNPMIMQQDFFCFVHSMMLELKNLLLKNLSKANKKPIFGHTIQLRDLSSALCIMDIIKKKSK